MTDEHEPPRVGEQQILVLADVGAGGLTTGSREALTLAASLAGERGLSLVLGLLGPRDAVTAVLDHDCPDVPLVCVASNDVLVDADPEASRIAAESIVRRVQPVVVLVPHGPDAMIIAPYLAQRLDGTVVTNCHDARWSDKGLLVTSTAHEGATSATYVLRGRGPHVLTVAMGIHAPVPAASRAAEVVEVDAGLDGYSPRVRVVSRRPVQGPRLRTANIVVAGGGGLREPADVDLLDELARVLDGAVGVSRPLVARGWASADRKVGLTGTTISPDVYLAFGISGASQHMAGCARARTIVAVNTDRGAPIFRHAQLGASVDASAVLRALLALLGDRDGAPRALPG